MSRDFSERLGPPKLGTYIFQIMLIPTLVVGVLPLVPQLKSKGPTTDAQTTRGAGEANRTKRPPAIPGTGRLALGARSLRRVPNAVRISATADYVNRRLILTPA